MPQACTWPECTKPWTDEVVSADRWWMAYLCKQHSDGISKAFFRLLEQAPERVKVVVASVAEATVMRCELESDR